ncbi:TPA: hypothetical protein ACYLN4_000692 [Burkholderia lata]
MCVFQYDDGGRADAGFKGAAGDCVTRAVAIATGKPYADVYRDINELGRERSKRGVRGKTSARTGVQKDDARAYLAWLGWQWHPTMTVGAGCTVHLRADELPSGRIVVKLSRHVAAVIDGVLHDTHDCSRGGTRCVYGYWSQN